VTFSRGSQAVAVGSDAHVDAHGRTAARPRVALIGGLTRGSFDWRRAGDAIGVELEHHDGNTAGNRSDALAAIVRRADVVITILIPNSHNGVALARRTAASQGRPFVLVKRLGPSALGRVVADALAQARAGQASR